MKKKINIAKAKYRKNLGYKILDSEIAEKLLPTLKDDNSMRVTFQNIKNQKRALKYDELIKLAEILHCTPQFLIGSEKYSFIK
jgi:hypothetical protein